MSDVSPMDLSTPGDTEDFYYVVHGHGCVRTAVSTTPFAVPDVVLHFYCAAGQSTSDASQFDPNADWSKLLERLLAGTTLPERYVVQTLAAGDRCEPLQVSQGPYAHRAGVWFVRRPEGKPPIAELVSVLPADETELFTLINGQITPHASDHNIQRPFKIHYIACRVHR